MSKKLGEQAAAVVCLRYLGLDGAGNPLVTSPLPVSEDVTSTEFRDVCDAGVNDRKQTVTVSDSVNNVSIEHNNFQKDENVSNISQQPYESASVK